jgi:hypothetical protein
MGQRVAAAARLFGRSNSEVSSVNIIESQQVCRLMNKPDKVEADVEREQSLISQWVSLTEERNAVYLPTPNSTIPGAPAEWTPPPGIEQHIPVLFFDFACEYQAYHFSLILYC